MMCSKSKKFLVIPCLGFFVVCVTLYGIFLRNSSNVKSSVERFYFEREEIDLKLVNAIPRRLNCTYSLCLDVYKCSHEKLGVYLYPIKRYFDKESQKPLLPEPSKEFLEIRKTISTSDFYEGDPEKACLLVPSIDLLNQNRISTVSTSKILASLKWWGQDGGNHLIFNMLPGSVPDYNSTLDVGTGIAIVAGGGFSTTSYRKTFDISIPVWNPLTRNTEMDLTQISREETNRFLLVAVTAFVHRTYRNVLAEILKRDKTADTKLLIVDKCSSNSKNGSRFDEVCGVGMNSKIHFQYPQVLMRSHFCLVLEGSRLGQTLLSDCLQGGSIPVVVSDEYVLPFSEVLDWKRASVQLYNHQLPRVLDILSSFSRDKIELMRRQVKHFWTSYFQTMATITLTVLNILNDRIYPFRAKSYSDWNEPEEGKRVEKALFLPRIAPKHQGFTAVLLSYDRVGSLFKSIKLLGEIKSLAKVVVVWNNPKKSPPSASEWPKISKPIEILKMKENKLGNRFLPLNAIKTEAVLSLDDDIVQMLNSDEIEFGYQVWCQYSSYLVGFPARVHVYDPVSGKFFYNSEWTNNVSMILTGAAFYHKYYGYLYTEKLPLEIQKWVDKRMNCEDIAMNFLLAYHTGQPAIKVTPKKKFRCPECTAAELATDKKHLEERSECIKEFSKIFNSTVTLKTVEFRVDPVLFKNPVIPDFMKKYPGVKSV